MRKLVIVAMLVVCQFSSVCWANDKSQSEWARQIAMDFFESVFTDNSAEYNSVGLLSPELAMIHKRGDIANSPILSLNCMFTAASITKEQFSPDSSEAVFSGDLVAKDKRRQCKFVMRVAKESNGKWSIRYLRIHEPPLKK